MPNNLSSVLLERINTARGGFGFNPYNGYLSAVSIARILYGSAGPQVDALSELKSLLGTPVFAGTGSPEEIKKKQVARFQQALWGYLDAMTADIQAGLVGSLESQYQGEIFADFVTAAKSALDQGAKDPAAVLACSALEDSLKRYAEMNEIDVGGREMQDVINALKSKGLISGPQKGIVDAFPRLRNAAMHADWSKIQPEDVRGVIGFVEQFLLTRFGHN
jgi:hypothetical protein